MKTKKLEEFIACYHQRMREPIIQKFLEEKKNYNLFLETINNPSKSNKERLDKKFQEHYKNVKIKHYMSKLIHFYSIDFDKKYNRNKFREILQIDGSPKKDIINTNFNFEKFTSSIGDLTIDNYEEKQNRLESVIENEILFKSLKFLSEKQIQILEMIYLHQYSNKEIALLLNESAQTISYNHKSALSKLKYFLTKKKWSNYCDG